MEEWKRGDVRCDFSVIQCRGLLATGATDAIQSEFSAAYNNVEGGFLSKANHMSTLESTFHLPHFAIQTDLHPPHDTSTSRLYLHPFVSTASPGRGQIIIKKLLG